MFIPGGFEQYFIDLGKVRAEGGPDLLQQEEAIDEKYGIIINRRA